MKRLFWILPVLLLLLTGCDNRQQVGVCFRDCDDPLTVQYRQDLEQLLTDAGYAVTVMDAANDQSKQDRQIEQLIADRVDILVVEPVIVSAAGDSVQKAMAKNVPVVFVNREPEQTVLDSWDRLCFVGYDTAQPGKLQGQLVAGLPENADLNGDGVVAYVILAGPEDHLDAQIRSQTCRQALSEAELQVEELALDYGDWDRADAQRRTERLLSTYGKDIEVILCNSDELALGAMDAIVDGGRTVGENVYLLGIGGELQSLLLIRSGDLTGTVSTDVLQQTQNVLSAVQTLLAGNTPEKINYINHITIDADNVEDYIGD